MKFILKKSVEEGGEGDIAVVEKEKLIIMAETSIEIGADVQFVDKNKIVNGTVLYMSGRYIILCFIYPLFSYPKMMKGIDTNQ